LGHGLGDVRWPQLEDARACERVGELTGDVVPLQLAGATKVEDARLAGCGPRRWPEELVVVAGRDDLGLATDATQVLGAVLRVGGQQIGVPHNLPNKEPVPAAPMGVLARASAVGIGEEWEAPQAGANQGGEAGG